MLVEGDVCEEMNCTFVRLKGKDSRDGIEDDDQSVRKESKQSMMCIGRDSGVHIFNEAMRSRKHHQVLLENVGRSSFVMRG